MGKLTGAFAVQDLEIHTQCLEEIGQDDATNRVDGVGADTELAGLDSLDIYQTEVKHRLDVLLVHGVVLDDTTQLLNRSVVEVLFLGNSQYLGAVGSGQELALAVQQLQGVPLGGVVAGGDDDTAVGLVPAYSQLGCWRGGQTDIDDLVSHANQCAANDVAHHGARDTSITTNDNLLAADECGIGRCELDNVQRIQCVTRVATNGATDT